MRLFVCPLREIAHFLFLTWLSKIRNQDQPPQPQPPPRISATDLYNIPLPAVCNSKGTVLMILVTTDEM